MVRLTIALMSGLVAGAWSAQGVAAGTPFDGRWSVTLVCPETTDKSGPVKGYEYVFAISIHDGGIEGHYGDPGHPASVVYTGRVGDDGTLEIAATGNTGRPEYAVGRVAQGSSYRYTMQGKLEGSRGTALRREVRPCTAAFARTDLG